MRRGYKGNQTSKNIKNTKQTRPTELKTKYSGKGQGLQIQKGRQNGEIDHRIKHGFYQIYSVSFTQYQHEYKIKRI